MRNIYFVMVLSCLFFSNLSAQQQPASWSPNTMPPPANAASLGIYGSVPISLYTGLPSISIPIYTVQYRDINLPISLSYHAQGVNIQQQASWVGLNWSLSAGGVITRTIRGFDDLLGNNNFPGFPYNTFQGIDLCNINYDFYDVEPDIYFYNFAGKSGKFYLGKVPSGQLYAEGILTEGEKISIRFYPDVTQSISGGGHWEIITADGTSYNFGTKEYTFTRGSKSYTNTLIDEGRRDLSVTCPTFVGDAGSDVNCLTGNNNPYGDNTWLFGYQESGLTGNNRGKQVGSWQLDKIVSSTGTQIDFIYDMTSNYTALSPLMRSQSLEGNKTFPIAFFYNAYNEPLERNIRADCHTTQMLTKERLLKEIRFGYNKVVFTTEDREDIDWLPADANTGATPSAFYNIAISKPQRLKQISVVNNLGTTTKFFDFSYDYFNNQAYTPTPYFADRSLLRLKLTGLTENRIKKHQFEYDERKPLPSKNSFDKDHWGYYNGEYSNFSTQTLFPRLTYQYYDKLYVLHLGIGTDAIRRPDIGSIDPVTGQKDYPYLKSGILTKIIYPTGGYSKFDYEPNSYVRIKPEDQNDDVLPITNSFSNAAALVGGSGNVAVSGRAGNYETSVPFQVNSTSTITFSVDIKCGNQCKDFPAEANLFQIVPANNDGSAVPAGSASIYSFKANGVDCSGVWVNPPPTIDVTTCPHLYKNVTVTNLSPGSYRIKIKNLQSSVSGPDIKILNCSVSFTLPDQVPDVVNGGGLRIKQLTDAVSDTDPSPNIKNYSYESSGRTSGVLMSNVVKYIFPKLPPLANVYGYCNNGSGFVSIPGDPESNPRDDFVEVHSSSNYPLSSSATGSAVGYSRVVVGYGINDINGRSEYLYENVADLLRITSSGTFPYYNRNVYIPNFPNDPNLNNGFLYREVHYKKINNNFIPTREALHSNSSPQPTIISTGYKRYYGYIGYDVKKRWVNQWQDTEMSYDMNAPAGTTPLIRSITEKYADNSAHYMPTRTVTYNSNGDQTVQITTYPEDYPAGTTFIDNMKSKFVHALPIEQVVYKMKPSGQINILSGQINTYQNDCPTCKDQTFLLENPAPVPQSSFKFSNSVPGIIPFPLPAALNNTAFARFTGYQPRITFNSYTGTKTLRSYTPVNGTPTVILWGYESKYPIAEIKNATLAQVLSFLGNTTEAALDIYGAEYVPSTDYLSRIASLRNNLRINLPEAMITTYTYEPLVGIKSATDANNVTVSYEYDDMQRLKYIRDLDGNIIKEYQYHYKGQTP